MRSDAWDVVKVNRNSFEIIKVIMTDIQYRGALEIQKDEPRMSDEMICVTQAGRYNAGDRWTG